MKKKLFQGFLAFLFLILLFSSGCAHRPESSSSGYMSGSSLSQNEAVISDDEDDLNDDFGLLEDEFEEEADQISDPLYYWNKVMFHINDKLYYWAMKPISKGYKAATPTFFRRGIKNFFRNLTTPLRFVNCVLQGKGNAAEREFARFLVNSSIGVLGIGDPASKYPKLKAPDSESFGQTFATYGIGEGFYIVWPVLGPSTLRNSVGMIGDKLLSPVSYVDPTEASAGITALDMVNSVSFKIGDYESLKKASIDPYTAFRNIYLQNFRKKVEK
ncbi:MAG: VacJ family lipoprotein [Desulfobacterales bacterium]|nr:VacJ family lipoprotein [Desulfobacteraceae bacterium]MBT4363971.1 VacJ family lipoprotein [Desulfobacteraceae bacterium]MBT7086235.1 VacJ family lipoprotein [Desulfobacterales bacterium]MBT7696945.1 VacJ family lipoprotein [Desulfobacterales bacterium]